jgi:uncharacterized protein with LGFP repeats
MKNKYIAKAGVTTLTALMIAAGIGVPAQATTPVSGNAINTYSRAAVAAAYANQWLPTTTSPINWTGDAATCQAGTESADSLAKGTQAINFYRGLAGLDSISLTSSQNTMAQTTALMMEANGVISHTPDSSWKCYTALGAQGASTSNLFGGAGAFSIGSAGTPIKAYMDDTGATNGPVGHRRWVLNPSTVTMGMGTTKGFNALNIAGAPTDTARTSPTMIGFPGAGYFPQQLEPNGKWSVSSDQGVDFSAATVSVKDANGTALGVIPLSTTEGYGPNTISFQVQGLAYASGTSEADYKVTVDNMTKNNLPFSYTYTVRLFDGTVSTSSVAPADPMPTLPTPIVTVVPQSPTFGSTNYVVPATTGVVYKVNGVVTQAGTYDASTPITITAEAASGYAITGETTWSKDFTPVVVQPIVVTPTAPTFTATTYTIPYQAGVDYQVNGGSRLQGTYPAAAPVSITAVALPGYTLTGTTTWSKDFTPVGSQPTSVTPVAPTLGSTSYTIPSVTGVDYLVDNNVKAAGTYNATTNVTIVARAQAGYVLSGTSTWSKDFTPPANQSPIAAKAATLGGGLGAATSGEVGGLKNGGAYQTFEHGAIIWSPATGAHISMGAIRALWAATGYENGGLGYPTSDEVGGLKDGGVYQTFEHGAIVYAPGVGTFVSFGAIRALWGATGYQDGGLGYPTSNEVGGLKDGGVYQTYQHGAIVYAPGVGTFVSFGAIRNLWAATGYENGGLGYPTSNEIGGLKDGGVYQTYQHGAIVYAPGAGTFVSFGAIRGLWGATGYQDGGLGYPTSNETADGRGGVYQTYQHGAIVYSPTTGAHVSLGAIRSIWLATGSVNGGLGYPTSNEIPDGRGGASQNFQHGAIVYGPGAGTFVSLGAIRSMWLSTGAATGRLGYPTSNEYVTSPGNVAQNFQGGTIRWGSNGNSISYR